MLTTNYGALVPEDELLTHQIVDTFATVSQSDPSWTEKIWTCLLYTSPSPRDS